MQALAELCHDLGKGEVLSSILSGSTTKMPSNHRLCKRSRVVTTCTNAPGTCAQQIPSADTNLTPEGLLPKSIQSIARGRTSGTRRMRRRQRNPRCPIVERSFVRPSLMQVEDRLAVAPKRELPTADTKIPHATDKIQLPRVSVTASKEFDHSRVPPFG